MDGDAGGPLDRIRDELGRAAASADQVMYVHRRGARRTEFSDWGYTLLALFCEEIQDVSRWVLQPPVANEPQSPQHDLMAIEKHVRSITVRLGRPWEGMDEAHFADDLLACWADLSEATNTLATHLFTYAHQGQQHQAERLRSLSRRAQTAQELASGALRERKALRDRLADEEEGRSRADEAARIAREKYDSGLVAQNRLKESYATMSTDEGKIADNLRSATAGVVVVVALSLLAANVFMGDSGVVQVIALHLAVAVPGLALAGYTAKESAQHRKLSRWAGVMAVQLGTIQSYVEPLDQDQAQRLIASFGDRVLGDLPSEFGGATDDGNLTTALTVLEKAIERLGAKAS